ncbi:MAG TPA: DUF6051 family protein [Chitinophagaceae bacterium]|mgnify:CR=1 FL=1|nr:DUF6051 family protein [Chitinophagaceae bacterium]HMU57922.1 DUF6051 family protein [Chitinophagaceae bacterium]
MTYADTYHALKAAINFSDEIIQADESVDVLNFDFESLNYSILPGEDSYHCPSHQFSSSYCYPFSSSAGVISEVLDIHDSHVQENKKFRYHIFMPKGQKETESIVLMLHGFNEKSWAKYYPWAKRITELTGKAVVLFPIAFHMNRAPNVWSHQRGMFAASEQRKKMFPNLLHSSLSNVAISTRLHEKPQRFVWSGLQTYYDVIQLVEQIKSGGHTAIKSDAAIDIFSYSIGAFLSEILVMTNYNNYFDATRLVMFCGGPVFNRISPVSKFILDSEANVNLYSFLVEHLDSHITKDDRLKHYLSEQHPEGLYFRSMLNYNAMVDFREQRIRKISEQLYAIALDGDTVIYPYEVLNTLQGKYRSTKVRVDILDSFYEFIHEAPFPEKSADELGVSLQFDTVFQKVCNWLE